VLELVLSGESIAVPPSSGGEDVCDDYIRRLLDWRSLLGTRMVHFYWSERTMDALVDAGLFPLGPRFRDMLDSEAFPELSANDLLRVANDLLARSSFLEDRIGVADVLWSNVTSVPDIVASAVPAELQRDLERTLALLSVAAGSPAGRAADLVLVLSRPTTPQIDSAVGVECAEARPGMAEAIAHVVPPAVLRATVMAGHDLLSLVRHANEAVLWSGVVSADDAAAVVRMCVLKERPGGSWETIRAFSVQDRFLANCVEHGFMRDHTKARKLVAAIVDVILARNERDGHALRTGGGGNNPPILRGNDVAWRHDVDYEYHLHLWKTSSTGIEFAALVTHNDFTIPA